MKEFRCPFEVKGEEAGLILTVELTEDSEKRLALVRAAYLRFFDDQSLISVRFVLPAFLQSWATANDEALQGVLLLHQCELHAIELEHRLAPFLPHQLQALRREDGLKVAEQRPADMTATHHLLAAAQSGGSPIPRSARAWADWMLSFFQTAQRSGVKSPQLIIGDFISGKVEEERKLLTISPGGIIFHSHRGASVRELNDPKRNKNCFHIVKTPFYPPDFGRYAARIEMVMTREADINALSAETRKKIRTQANRVHKRYGVLIRSVSGDKQPTGFWIPEYQAAAAAAE